jgi:hypothetical protein
VLRHQNSTEEKCLLWFAASILPLAWVAFAGSGRAEMSVFYRGELVLPMPLYTGDGIRLDKGKCEIEIRSEKAHAFLAFLRNGALVALVNGRPIGAERRADKPPDLPMLGTIYLYPPGPPRIQEKEEKSSVTFAEHLVSRPWKAVLRVYRYSNPQRREVNFMLQEESKPGEWSRTEFNLFLQKPS